MSTQISINVTDNDSDDTVESLLLRVIDMQEQINNTLVRVANIAQTQAKLQGVQHGAERAPESDTIRDAQQGSEVGIKQPEGKEAQK